jgi:hypothetical protein
MTWRLPCAWRGGHRWATLGLEAGRADLECARCGVHSTGWDLPDRIGRGGHGVPHLYLKVIERIERQDGTIQVFLNDPHWPAACSLMVLETRGHPYRLGDCYEVTLTPFGRTALEAVPR